jgi:N-acetylglutamate synthase-like GNAT family acetyltransferase
MKIIIRNARHDDLDTMTMLLGGLFSIETDFAVDPRCQRRGLALMLDGCMKHRCIKVAETDDRVVGMCSAQLLISTAQGGMAALVEDMVVKEGFQGMGIGRQLMNAIEQWAVDHGAGRLQLLADRNNHPALAFYKNLEWQSTQLICMRKTHTSFKSPKSPFLFSNSQNQEVDPS